MEIDQIFVGIHVRCARLVSSVVPRPLRSLLQAGSLLLSVFLLASLIWLHHQHIHPQGTHYSLTSSNASTSSTNGGFPSLVEWMHGSDVLRLCIEPPSGQYDMWRARGWSGWWSDRDRIAVVTQSYSEQNDKDDESAADTVAVSAEVSSHPSQHQSTFTLRHVNRPPNFSSSPALPSSQSHSHSHSSPDPISELACSPRHVYEYAPHKGYFLLPASLYSRHRVVSTTVTMPASHRAFGAFPLSFFTYHVYGYDSIVLNHLIRQMRVGFMRNANTNDIYTLSGTSRHKPHDIHSTPAAAIPTVEQQPVSTLHRLGHLLYLLFFKSELLVTTLFLFFATTTLVSSTLTQTQLRMLHFTDQLRQHIRLHLPIVGLVLEHTMQSLSFVPVVVGILFFLFEFFNDQVLAFLLLMLVWLCESYTVLFTRTTTSMLYFPKLFALYFLMFSVYFFSFPYGFHYIAMGLTASQLYTCILYYWFEYEIPAVEAGDISIHRPRMLVLRRADGGEREREEADAAHARGEGADRVRGAETGAAAAVERGREGAVGSREELVARLLSSHEDREAQQGDPTSGTSSRSASSTDVHDDGDVNEFEFSRRPLPRISTSSSSVPARSAVSIAPASANPYSTSSLPVPSVLSTSLSAPGQVIRPSSTSSTTSLEPDLASPLPPALHSPMPTSSPLPSVPSSSTSYSSALDAHTEAGLQRLHSLTPLLHTLLRHTQQLKAQYSAPASPRHFHSHSSSHSHRARAASAVSPTLSPLAHKDETILDDAPSLSITPPAVSLASEESKEQPTVTSPRAARVLNEPGVLHKLMLDQLSNVLQVSLYALTTLLHNPPHTSASAANTSIPSTSHSSANIAAPALIPLALPLPSEATVGGTVSNVHSLPVPSSPVSRSPRSPRLPATPSPPPLPLPRSSPPSSHRTSSSFSLSPSVSSSAPVRRLVFGQRSSGSTAVGAAVPSVTAGAAAASASSGSIGHSGAVDSEEPASPDPASEAPMM